MKKYRCSNGMRSGYVRHACVHFQETSKLCVYAEEEGAALASLYIDRTSVGRRYRNVKDKACGSDGVGPSITTDNCQYVVLLDFCFKRIRCDRNASMKNIRLFILNRIFKSKNTRQLSINFAPESQTRPRPRGSSW